LQDAEHRNESPRIGSEKASWEAAEGLGKQGKIKAAVFDEDDATLDAIQSGTIAATVVQKPFQFGCLSAKWMHDLATKGDAAKKALLALAGREDGGSKPYGLRHRARTIVVRAHGGDIKAHTQPRTETSSQHTLQLYTCRSPSTKVLWLPHSPHRRRGQRIAQRLSPRWCWLRA